MHTKVLAVLYFLSGYVTAFSLFWTNALHLRCLACFLIIYLTYQLVEQLEQ